MAKEITKTTKWSNKDDETKFVIRPITNQGKKQLVFTSVKACLEHFDKIRNENLKAAQDEYDREVLKLRHKLTGQQHFWDGVMGLEWWVSQYGIKPEDIK